MSKLVTAADDNADTARRVRPRLSEIQPRRVSALTGRPSRGRRTTPEPTLGSVLERDRLRHRAQRLAAVVMELRRRTHDESAAGRPTPVGLRQAITGFERELAAVRRRLDSLG